MLALIYIYIHKLQLQQPGSSNLAHQTIIAGQALHEQTDMQARIGSVASSNQGMAILSAANSVPPNNQNVLHSTAAAQIPNSPSRPSILRRREGEREIPGRLKHKQDSES